MRKMMTLLFALVTATEAQTWNVSGGFTDQFFGCLRTKGGTVECTLTSTYSGPLDTAGSSFFAGSTKAFTPDGLAVSATSSAVAGKPGNAYATNVAYKNIPVKVVYTFNYPHALNFIRTLMMNKGTIQNVTIAGSSVPVAGSTTSASAVQLGTTQAVVGGKAYTINLTNCKLSSGIYTCTSTLVPLH